MRLAGTLSKVATAHSKNHALVVVTTTELSFEVDRDHTNMQHAKFRKLRRRQRNRAKIIHADIQERAMGFVKILIPGSSMTWLTTIESR